MMANNGLLQCEQHLNHFKVNELQNFLTHFREQKVGKKSELLQRCIHVLRQPRTQEAAILKVREIAGRSTNTRVAPYPTPVQHSNGYNSSMSNSYRPNVNSGYSGYSGMAGMNIGGLGGSMMSSSPITMHPRPARNLIPINLPFYDPIMTLLEPQEIPASRSMQKENSQMNITFFISPEHAAQLAAGKNDANNIFPRTEVQLRFFNTSGDISGIEQPDEFPLNCAVKVDDQPVALPPVIATNKPNVEPKRPSRPVNLSAHCCHRDPKQYRMRIEWTADKRSWAVGIYLVSRVNASILRDRAEKNKGFTQDYEKTAADVRRRLNGDDDDVAMESLKISLLCPLGKTRMSLPARSRECTHLQCFDLDMYLQMNEKRPTWKCCVCSGNAPYNRLVIDKYFMKIIADVGSSVSDVELLKDGSYRVIKEDVFDLSDDEDGADIKPSSVHGGGSSHRGASSVSSGSGCATSIPAPSTKMAEKKKDDMDIITLSDDEDFQDQVNLRSAIMASMPTSAPMDAPRTPVKQATTSPSSDDSIIVLDDTPPRVSKQSAAIPSSMAGTSGAPSSSSSSMPRLVASSNGTSSSSSTGRPSTLAEALNQSMGNSARLITSSSMMMTASSSPSSTTSSLMGGSGGAGTPMSATPMGAANPSTSQFQWNGHQAPQSAPPIPTMNGWNAPNRYQQQPFTGNAANDYAGFFGNMQQHYQYNHLIQQQYIQHQQQQAQQAAYRQQQIGRRPEDPC